LVEARRCRVEDVCVETVSLIRMFNVGPQAAVAGAFKLAGYDGELRVAPIVSEDERAFLLEPTAFQALRDVRVLEQVVTQLLGRKVHVGPLDPRWGEPIPFE
jgi:hypothetical protein